ncbi:MAG: OmpH family outer membrane protein [Cytophagales bacterium]|nr:OmpH family outer membrane protein [Cytophagales bacterium]
MKKLIPLLFLLALMLPGVTMLHAQGAKIGYVDYKAVYQRLPAAIQAEQELNVLSEQNRNDIEQKRKALSQKYETHGKVAITKENADKIQADYQAEQTALAKETEQLRQHTEKKQQEVFLKRNQLYAGIATQIQQAIKAVAVQKGYSCIIDTGTVVYYSEDEDITLQVLAKLNIK